MKLVPLVAAIVLGAQCWLGCAGATAEAPLTVSLGQPREAAERDLHAHQYCRKSTDPPQREEVYPRCDRPGTEWGDSWVAAVYEKDQLVELRRWERYSDDAHAVERWNQLVADRGRISPASEEAAQALRDRGLLQIGTRTVRAFRVDDRTVVGIYLLSPSPPENATVLEKISFVSVSATPAAAKGGPIAPAKDGAPPTPAPTPAPMPAPTPAPDPAHAPTIAPAK